MISDIPAALRAAEVASSAVFAAIGVRLSLSGGLALGAHGALGRQVADVNLTTEQEHDAGRVMELVTSALQFIDYEVHPDPVEAAVPGSLRAILFKSPGQRPDADGQDPTIRLTTARMPQYSEPVRVQRLGMLPVSSMTTLAVHSLQDARRRIDPRDYVDLTMETRHWGAEAFGRLTAKVLDHESRNLPAREDPASPYLRMHRSLSRVEQIPDTAFTSVGVKAAQAETVRTTMVAMAEMVGRAAPKTQGSASGVLQRLLELPESDRVTMRAWLDARNIDETYIRDRVPSPAQMAEARSAAAEAVRASLPQQAEVPSTPAQQHGQAQREGQQGGRSDGRAGYR